MSGSGRSTRYDGALIEALVIGANQVEAARHAGITERTVRRRLDDPGFRRRLQEARAEALKRTLRRLDGMAESAMTTLHEISRNVGGAANAPNAGVRVRAARGLLAGFLAQHPATSKVEVGGTVDVGYDRDAAASALDKLRTFVEAARPNGHDATSNGSTS